MEIYYKVENGKPVKVKKDDPDVTYVMIDIAQYHGLKTALGIVERRAIQQVDKAKADENGYIILGCHKQEEYFGNYIKALRHQELQADCWKIKKRTPFSTKIPLKEIEPILKMSLEEHYAPIVDTVDIYVKMEKIFGEKLEEPELVDYLTWTALAISSETNGYKGDVRSSYYFERINALMRKDKKDPMRISVELNEINKYIKWLDTFPNGFIYSIVEMYPNPFEGLWEITYLSTKPV